MKHNTKIIILFIMTLLAVFYFTTKEEFNNYSTLTDVAKKQNIV